MAELELEMREPGGIRAFPIAAAEAIIYKGNLVMWHATSGYVINGADTASCVFCGIAKETVDNSAGAAGDKYITVYTKGCFKLPAAGMVVADVATLCYLSAVQAVADKDGPTNDVPVGLVVELVSATSVWVELGLPAPVITA